MKTKIALIILLLCPLLKATSPNLSTIQQPANLVGDSLSGCIPLAPAVCFANNDFYTLRKITAAHPIVGGAKEWKGGTESNANLASVFGITVSPDDGSFDSSDIHIKDWAIPAYSPHTKEEVLAATIHCLLLSCRATADHPFEIRITTENKDDQAWAKPFAKKYIRLPGKDKKPVTPTPVGESFIMTDGYGIQYVISPKLNPKRRVPKIAPVIHSIEYEYDGKPPGLISFWPATSFNEGLGKPLKYLGFPRGHLYNLSVSPRFSPELNSLLGGGNYFSIRSKETNELVEVRMSFSAQSLRDVTSGIASAALTTRITYGKPMKIIIDAFGGNPELITALLKTPGWEKTSVAKRSAATSTFDYDPKSKSFTIGTLPAGVVINSYPDGRLYLKQSQK